MLELPPLVVQVHGGVELRLPEVAGQVFQQRARFLVYDDAVVQHRIIGRSKALHRLVKPPAGLGLVGQLVEGGAGQLFQAEGAGNARVLGEAHETARLYRIQLTHAAFHVGVHALVHPRKIPLIGAQNAVEPVVAHLVHDGLGLGHGHHRVFHAAARAQGPIHGGGGRIGVLAYPARVVGEGVVHVLKAFYPFRGLLIGEEHPRRDRAARGQRHTAFQHVEALISKPGEVVNAVLLVAQGFGGGIGGREFQVGAEILGGFLASGGGSQGIQAGALVGVLQLAGGPHGVVGGQGDGDVERTVLGVELALVEVGDGVPAAPVQHGRLGVPLRNLVALPHVPKPRKRGRNLHPKRRADAGRGPRRQRLRQHQLGDVGVGRVEFQLRRLAIHLEVEAIDEAPVFGFGKLKPALAVA